ncbi:hypothetical protein GQ53DRAFT_861050, partial [Thozetella sp. PMI_491]
NSFESPATTATLRKTRLNPLTNLNLNICKSSQRLSKMVNFATAAATMVLAASGASAVAICVPGVLYCGYDLENNGTLSELVAVAKGSGVPVCPDPIPLVDNALFLCNGRGLSYIEWCGVGQCNYSGNITVSDTCRNGAQAPPSC